MKRLLPVAIAAATLALYCGVIAVGVRLHRMRMDWTRPLESKAWRIDRQTGMSAERLEAIEYGRKLFDETPVYAVEYTKSRISCANCHLEGGIAPYAAPVVGSSQAYPMFSKRAGRKITLEDRIEECMTRSENGRALASDSREMKGMLAYIDWLSEPHANQKAFVGRGLKGIAALQPDPKNGARVYGSQCAGCHGVNGEGTRPQFPPLWGEGAFNDGAGMSDIQKMAAFVKVNMPHNRKGILSAQEAFDVAAYIHAQPRPAFNHEYDRF